jgi:rubredoxin
MRKYVCSVCGFVYDEAIGIPEADVPAGTLWEQLPSGCAAPGAGRPKRTSAPKVQMTCGKGCCETSRRATRHEWEIFPGCPGGIVYQPG